MAASEIDRARIIGAAERYAALERHGRLAARALLAAAERIGASGLAVKAIERGLHDPTAIARAIEIAARDRDPDARKLPWAELARGLDGAGPIVARARGIASIEADRPSDALAAFAEATRGLPDDATSHLGLGRALLGLARHDEAISALDRAATLADGDDALDARLRAARAALAAGHREAAIARLREIVDGHPTSAYALHAHGDLARTLDPAEAIALDRSLPALTDALGGMYAAESASALRWAITRALQAKDAAWARALGQALARVRGDASELGALETQLAAVEAEALASTDVATLRARADAMRRAGDHGEAGRALIEVFAQTKDAAVLRAAIDLADRAASRDVRRAVFERALALLPPGAARDAIASRR
jgi:tetratricopeptide (TPR) repeat protein